MVFPYFLQFKSEFGNKEFMIWATVSSWSCFCWVYRATPFLSTKNIINLICISIIDSYVAISMINVLLKVVLTEIAMNLYQTLEITVCWLRGCSSLWGSRERRFSLYKRRCSRKMMHYLTAICYWLYKLMKVVWILICSLRTVYYQLLMR